MNDSVVRKPLEAFLEIACARSGTKGAIDKLLVLLCKLAGKGFPNQPHALDDAGGCMFAKIGFVSLDDLHTADNKVFLEQVLELFGNVC